MGRVAVSPFQGLRFFWGRRPGPYGVRLLNAGPPGLRNKLKLELQLDRLGSPVVQNTADTAVACIHGRQGPATPSPCLPLSPSPNLRESGRRGVSERKRLRGVVLLRVVQLGRAEERDACGDRVAELQREAEETGD